MTNKKGGRIHNKINNNSNNNNNDNNNLDSRAKKRRTNQDIININAAIEQLMKQNDVNSVADPAQNPFVFLWLANRVIYSVVVAFLVMKGWEKK